MCLLSGLNTLRSRCGVIMQDQEALVERFVIPFPLSKPVTSPNAYTERDLHLAESVSAQISGAIANAQLFQRLEAGEAELRRLTQKVLDTQE